MPDPGATCPLPDPDLSPPLPHPEYSSPLIDAMSEGLYVVDRGRQITFWNPAAAQIAGYPAETVVGRWCGDGLLNHVDEQGTPMCGSACPLRKTMEDGVQRSSRAYLHHGEGHMVPVRITASPLRDADGTITGAVETFSDDSHVRAVEKQLGEAEQLALVDPLTGIGNRRNLDLSSERRFADWRRHGHRFAVLVVDVDEFKTINDTHGHDVGDKVLTVIAHSLANAVRNADEVFRAGGDEFAVLTGPITQDELSALAARLRMVVSAGRYPVPHRVTVSIGGALIEDDDEHSGAALRADRRLLQAKRSGRDASVSDSEEEPAA